MRKGATRILVYSLAGILLSGVGAPIVEAATQNRDNRQRDDRQRQERQRDEKQRNDRKRDERQRPTPQRDQQRDERQRPTPQRDQQRNERQRPTPQRENSREWQNRNNHHQNNDGRRHVYHNERYRTSHWRASSNYYEHRQPWFWHSRNHVGRHRIIDFRWDREFPGLRSYRWHGPGFWYRGTEYRDLVLFYDDENMLVAIGFWNFGRFIMIRDDNRSYYNTNPFVLDYQNHNIQIRIRL